MNNNQLLALLFISIVSICHQLMAPLEPWTATWLCYMVPSCFATFGILRITK